MKIEQCSNKSKIHSLKLMIDSIYKILCMYDENNYTIPTEWLNKTIQEIHSANESYFNGELAMIIIKLNILNDKDNQDKKRVKQITLDCANSLARMRDVLLNG